MLSEAGRNLAAGASRAGAFALAVAITGAVLGIGDGLAVGRLTTEAREFRTSGGSVWVTDAEGLVNGAACERLAEIDGVRRSGAADVVPEGVVFASTPSADLPLMSVTPGFADLLDAQPTGTDGLLLSEQVAERYGLRTGDAVALVGPDNLVGGTFRYPADGRRPGLEYSVLRVVPPEGTFDQCWIEMWPTAEGAALLTKPALRPGATADVRTMQLNATLGAGFDGDRLLGTRSTRQAAPLALAVGLVLGFLAIWVRRLELASARHLGVGVLPQLAQLLVEASVWGTAGALAAAALVQAVVRAETDAAASVFAVRPVVAVAVGAVCGAAIGVMAIRERQVLRLFKDR